MRVAFDTNVLAYAEGFDEDARRLRANEVVDALARHVLILPVQVSAELTHVVLRKFGQDVVQAAQIVRRWQRICSVHPASTGTTFQAALGLMADHRLQMFDALILAAAHEADADALFSEDMHDGFVWRGVTVVNPFKPDPHPLLADLLRPH